MAKGKASVSQAVGELLQPLEPFVDLGHALVTSLIRR
jgi:hypothetical protein